MRVSVCVLVAALVLLVVGVSTDNFILTVVSALVLLFAISIQNGEIRRRRDAGRL